MKIAKLLELHEKGFNVPLFVLNPYRKYKQEVLTSLRSYVFSPATKVSIYAEKNFYEKKFVRLTLQDAAFILAALEKKDYEILVVEDPEWELIGSVEWDKTNEEGKIRVENEETQFHFLEAVEPLRMRHIVRTCREVVESLDGEYIRVFFGWATGFVGVKCSKLIIYDYKILKVFLDK